MANKQITKLRQQLNLDRRVARLGDGSGETHDRRRPGNYYVRFTRANGTYTAPVSMPAAPNANLPTDDGTPVEVGFDLSGRQVILQVNVNALAATGTNNLQLNPLDQQASKFVNQTQISTFYATRHADVTNKPFYAVVFPGIIYPDGNILYFAGGEIDLSGFTPAAEEHCYAVVFIKSDGILEAFGSTAINVSDPLTAETDIQEAIDAMTAGSMPLWAVEMRGDDVALTVAPERWVDLRAVVGGGAVTPDLGQYWLLAGRAGGQTGYGGIAASENAVINSTAHATKGNVVLAGSLLTLNEASQIAGLGGAAVASQKLNIYTGADATKGLVIRAFSGTQSANLFEWRNSGGTILGSVSAIGNVLIGGTFTDNNVKLYSNNAITADPAANSYALFVQSSINASTTPITQNIYGAYYNLFTNAAHSGTVTAVFAQRNVFINGGSGIVTAATGNLISVTNTGGGTITTTIGLSVDSWHADTTATAISITANTTAVATTKTGLRIGNVSGATSNFAIQTNAGNVVFNEAGDSATDVRAEGDTDPNNFISKASTDRVGVGVAAPTTKLHTLLTDAGTNAVVNVLTVGHDTSGTAAAGFGVGLIFEGESSTTASQSMGRITGEYVVATHASRTTLFKLTAFDSTGEREAFRWGADGSVPHIGTPGKMTLYNNVATEGYGVGAIVDDVALTGQTANITATNFTNAGTTGTYRINYYLVATTAGVGAGTITVSIAWNDGSAAQTVTSAAANLTVLGSVVQGTVFIRRGSGTPTYATTVTGIFGTSQYALYLTCERVS